MTRGLAEAMGTVLLGGCLTGPIPARAKASSAKPGPKQRLTRRFGLPYHGARWIAGYPTPPQEVTVMRSKIVTVAALILVAFLAGACATSEQWAEWRGHTTHFASGDHGMFSLANNMEGTNPRVTRLDIENSRTQNWWGKNISVEPGQVI